MVVRTPGHKKKVHGTYVSSAHFLHALIRKFQRTVSQRPECLQICDKLELSCFTQWIKHLRDNKTQREDEHIGAHSNRLDEAADAPQFHGQYAICSPMIYSSKYHGGLWMYAQDVEDLLVQDNKKSEYITKKRFITVA